MENLYLRRPYTLKQEEEEFHNRDKSSGIIFGAEPFFFKGSNSVAILMIHGYTSSPRDLRELGASLNKLGYTAQGILLPGHGTKPTDLDNIQWNEWYSVVENTFLRLKEKYDTVNVVGFSMGGALAMYLASRQDVAKLVLLSPFFKLAYNPYHIVPEEWLVFSVGRLLRHLKKQYSGSCNNIEERNHHVAYYHYSLSSIKEALKLVSKMKENVKNIKNPLLIIHGKGDKTTSHSESKRIYNQINSEIKRFVSLNKSNHLITMDYDKEIVFREVIDFIKNDMFYKE